MRLGWGMWLRRGAKVMVSNLASSISGMCKSYLLCGLNLCSRRSWAQYESSATRIRFALAAPDLPTSDHQNC